MCSTSKTRKVKDAKDTARAKGKWQGMNWIRQDKRLAIYLRDGLSCCWCGASVEEGVTLTLDHLVPHSEGGSNHKENLVTACHRCNSLRAARGMVEFAQAVAQYVNGGVTALDILDHIDSRRHLPLTNFREEARELIARRGSAAKVIAHIAG